MSSFRAQYGVKINSQEFKEMTWDEFADLLSGLSPDSPLGRIVQIRLEDDEKILKGFSRSQMKIRSEWRSRKAKAMPQKEVDSAMEIFKNAFIAMSGG